MCEDSLVGSGLRYGIEKSAWLIVLSGNARDLLGSVHITTHKLHARPKISQMSLPTNLQQIFECVRRLRYHHDRRGHVVCAQLVVERMGLVGRRESFVHVAYELKCWRVSFLE